MASFLFGSVTGSFLQSKLLFYGEAKRRYQSTKQHSCEAMSSDPRCATASLNWLRARHGHRLKVSAKDSEWQTWLLHGCMTLKHGMFSGYAATRPDLLSMPIHTSEP